MYKIIGADGKEYGPVSIDQVKEWIRDGRADGRTNALAEGSEEWRPLIEFLEFAPLLAARPAPAPLPMAGPVVSVPKTNAMAITGFILGMLSVLGSWMVCCCYGFPLNLLGLIFSLVGYSQIKADPQNQRGKGIAIAGVVLSVLSIVLAALVWALGMALSSTDFWRKLQRF